MLEFFKKLFEPRPGTERWYKKASKDDVLALRNALQEIYRDPTKNKKLREQIYSYLPYLDKVIHKKK